MRHLSIALAGAIVHSSLSHFRTLSGQGVVSVLVIESEAKALTPADLSEFNCPAFALDVWTLERGFLEGLTNEWWKEDKVAIYECNKPKHHGRVDTERFRQFRRLHF